MYAPVKLACIQMQAEAGNLQGNLEKAERMCLEACENGANLMILPEVFNVGSSIYDRVSAYACAETIPDGPTVRMMKKVSEEKQVWLCGSLIERDGVNLYNTAVLTGPAGLIGIYRKLHLCGNETLYFEPGDRGIPVFHTELGRIAMLICLDAYYPETFRIAALQGADIILVPFNSEDAHEKRRMPEGCHTALTVLCQAAAVSNHIFVVGCDRTGKSGSYLSAGQSIIANPWGMPEVPIAPFDRETILYAQIDLSESRRKNINPCNNRLGDRRIDVYSRTLGYVPEKYQ